MKKIISSLILVCVFMTSMCIWASATNNTYSYDVGDVTYTVEFSDNNLTPSEQEIVAKKLIGVGDNMAQPYGLGCTLFGHDYKYTTASVVRHKVYSAVPRCEKKTYDVTYCEDCDYTKQTLISTNNIDCCPKD